MAAAPPLAHGAPAHAAPAPVDVLDPASLQGLATLAARALGSGFATVFLVDAGGRRRGSFDGGANDPDELVLWGSPSGEVLETLAPVVVPDLAAHPLYASFVTDDWATYVGVPIFDASGTAVGVVCAADPAPRDYGERDISSLELVAEQAKRMVEAARTMERMRELDAEVKLERGRLHAVLHGLGDGVALEDEDERILLINQAFVDTMRIPATVAELTGTDGAQAKRASADLVRDPETFLGHISAQMAGGERVLGVESHTHDGRILEWDYIPISVEGLERGHCWQMRDVTSRRNAEATALFAERHFLDLNEGAGALFRLDAHGNELWETAETQALFGTEVPFPEVVHPDDRDRVIASMGPLLSKPDSYTIRYRIQPEPDVLRHIEVQSTPLWDNDGRFEGYAGRILDVTDEAEARAALAQAQARHRAEHQRLAATIAGALDCIVPLDGQGRIVDFNPAAVEAFGLARTDAIGRPFSDLVTRGRSNVELLSAPRDTDRRLQFTAHHSSGRTFPVELAITTTQSDDGTRATVFLRDVSAAHEVEVERQQRLLVELAARHEAEQTQAELAEANEELRRLATVKDEVLAGVSHELRTPLTAMRTFLEMLSEDPTLEPAHQEPLAIVSRNAQRLERVVRDLLDLKDGKLELAVSVEPVELSTIMSDVSDTFWPRAAANGVRLPDAEDAPVHALADPARIAQVLDILLDNALKFTPEGGVIVQQLSADETTATITVRDSGAGIPAGELDRVFDRFFQAKGGRESGTGSGLGLAIAKALMEAMDGSISVRSSEGSGTTFTLHLPLHRPTSVES